MVWDSPSYLWITVGREIKQLYLDDINKYCNTHVIVRHIVRFVLKSHVVLFTVFIRINSLERASGVVGLVFIRNCEF